MLSSQSIASAKDSTAVLIEQAYLDTVPLLKEHSVRKATVFSALLPGAGQAYNKKYWKMPIVYGGIGACIYFIGWNTREYKFFRSGLIAELDGDPSTINNTGFSSGALSEGMEQHRTWLDISWMSLAGVYLLQILDANVDAHLFNFDVGEDLTINFHPSLIPSNRVNLGLTMTMKF
ncbi:MAG: hypothetical protein ACJAQ5_001449 [Flavobacteriales bacterium]